MKLNAAIGTLAASAAALVAAPVDYVREIQPLLAQNCYQCHGATQPKHGLRLDTAALALKGGQAGPAIKPGKSSDSLLVQVISGTHKDLARMPYKKPPLSAAQIALVRRWIDEGAKAPANEVPGSKAHWAFVAPKRPAVPTIGNRQSAIAHPIDAFIRARLAKEKLTPSPEADRPTLIRRLSLDLLGLPPKPADVDAFVNDQSPDAYEKLVERLLASPHYGERWGRWWLDVARYADSNGYSIDAPRTIWRYRDWVIAALNRDLPFDQFTIEQLAGDMLPNATMEQKVATGFHRNTQINQEGGIDKEQFRLESVVDRVNTTGAAWLGLTVGCMQCHDHKFDPLLQKEYYGLFAMLNNQDEPDLPLVSADQAKHVAEIEARVAGYIADLFKKDAGIVDRELKWETSMTPEQRQAMPQLWREVFDVPPTQRTDAQKLVMVTSYVEHAAENKTHQAAIKKFRAEKPKVETTMVMREAAKARRTYLHIKGDFTRDGGDVKAHFPSALHPFKGVADREPNRLDLAHWLVDEANPLTARVVVNRVWQQYFGKGLVDTENDFGTQGSLPSHPELLDWLAVEFQKPSGSSRGNEAPSEKAASQSLLTSAATRPWSLKGLHRLIVTSATYRQSSAVRADLQRVDANNKLLARQNRLRLDAEIVRDVGLTASGLLTPTLGGPSVYPPIPENAMALGQRKQPWPTSTGPDRFRRGLYTFYYRATPPPSMNVFDAPDGYSTCTRRIRSNTPLQALALLNDTAYVEFAEGLATRVLKEVPANDTTRLEHAFRLCLARKPSATEATRLGELLKAETASVTDAEVKAVKAPAGVEPKQFAAWTTVARVLLNLDEAITRE
ncbi:MAG: cytochrome c553 [Limisphaerales bacterium]|nr:MAG: cytochrome c553 [Limisphaerales bacterium]KAG0509546.1 MAG: cytochrome c553 [Limisphaerales bacterium]TXT52382.1 MAG: cytochrome c553 [Limisphaerales bacterium]